MDNIAEGFWSIVWSSVVFKILYSEPFYHESTTSTNDQEITVSSTLST